MPLSPSWLRRTGAGLCVAALLFPACQNDSVVERELGVLSTGCLVNSDCASPLVCAFERCHVECVTTRDCDGKLRCVGAREAERVCQLESEAACKTSTDCAKGLVCGSDGTCRDHCQRDSECIDGQLCTKGVCAEPEELDESGNLPQTLAEPTCRLSSDCPLGSRCEGGLCLPECLTERDCAPGSTCEAGACVAPVVERCEEPSDCTQAGEQCVDGTCRCECREDVDCASAESCDGCACVPTQPAECEGADDCAAGQQCVDGACLCGCVEDRDCRAGSRCDGCVCEPIPPRTSVDDATLDHSADLVLMQGIVEVKGKLLFRGPYLNSTLGLESLKTVGDLEVFQMSAAPAGLDGGNLLAGLSGLTLIRGNLTIATVYGFTSLKLNPALKVEGDVLIEGAQLSCEQIGELEQALRGSGFDGNFVARNNTACGGVCVDGACQP